MKSKIAAIFVGAAFVLSTANIAEACSRTVSKKAAQTVVPAGKINQSLLDAAIRNEVNFHRCRAGLPKVGDAGNGLTNQAKKHSQWMARSQQLSHRSTVAGSATLSQRVKNAGVRFRTGSENIAMVHRFRIDNRRFKILSSDQCKFATYEGQALPAHSYASLARHVVDLWMSSPGHRKNILDRRVNRVSTAVAFDPKAQYCGQYWLTQNFIG
jgi:uncharacterized protein YkwD